MIDLVMFGAGGLAREVLLLLNAVKKFTPEKEYNMLGFVVNEKYYKDGAVIGGYPVLGTEEWLIRNKDKVSCVCAIGEPKPRAAIQESLTAQGVNFVSIMHPQIGLANTARIGKGCIIQFGTTISADCVLGDGVFVNSYCTIGHDVRIGNYTCVMPGTGISGWVKIGREVKIGGHAYIVPHKKIGDYAVVGAGSVVFSNVKEKTTVLGNPAHRMPALEA